MAYSYQDLQGLWTSAGGPAAVAPLMAAIALAESAGDPAARNSSSGACGLWQIHPAQAGCDDPQQNARMAVAKYQSQGLGAWEAYTNGSYQQFLGASTTGKVPGSGSSTRAGTGLLAGVAVDPFGIGQGIGDFTGLVSGQLRSTGQHFVAGGQVLAGLLVLAAAAALMAWMFLTRTGAGRELARGSGRSARAAATIAVVAPK